VTNERYEKDFEFSIGVSGCRTTMTGDEIKELLQNLIDDSDIMDADIIEVVLEKEYTRKAVEPEKPKYKKHVSPNKGPKKIRVRK
jgi:hypothetical protein